MERACMLHLLVTAAAAKRPPPAAAEGLRDFNLKSAPQLYMSACVFPTVIGSKDCSGLSFLLFFALQTQPDRLI
jgi:hypothetical protein